MHTFSRLVGLAAVLGSAQALPQAAGSPDTPSVSINPSVLDVHESGSGCPIGKGGMVHQIKNGTPVFAFTGWGLTLNGSAIPIEAPEGSTGNNTNGPGAQDNHVKRGSVAKFCREAIALGNAPVGYQVHIGEVTISGVAELDPTTFIGVRVNTRFGRTEAGRANVTVPASALNNGTFSVTLKPSPVVWSSCVNETGLLPVISVRTTVSINGTAQEATGTFSSGKLGDGFDYGNATTGAGSMDKALNLHFIPEWRPCPAESLAPSAPSAPSETAPADPSSPPKETPAPAPPAPAPTTSTVPVPDPPIKDPPAPSPPMNMGGM